MYDYDSCRFDRKHIHLETFNKVFFLLTITVLDTALADKPLLVYMEELSKFTFKVQKFQKFFLFNLT